MTDALILIVVFGIYMAMYCYVRGYKKGCGIGYKIGFLKGATRVAFDNAKSRALCERTREVEE